jgi:hypothetical protein
MMPLVSNWQNYQGEIAGEHGRLLTRYMVSAETPAEPIHCEKRRA